MAPGETTEVTSEEGRALLTDREREVLSGEADVDDNYRYKVQSVVRNRLRKKLGRDVAFLATHFDEAHEIAVGAVCGDEAVIEESTRLGELREQLDDTRAKLRERTEKNERLREQAGTEPNGPNGPDPGRLADALSSAQRAVSELPEDAPGRGSVEDVVAILEREVGDDAE